MKKIAGIVALGLVVVVGIWGYSDQQSQINAAKLEAAQEAAQTAQVAQQTADQSVADAKSKVDELMAAVEAAKAVVDACPVGALVPKAT